VAVLVPALGGCASLDDNLDDLSGGDQDDRIDAMLSLTEELLEGDYEHLQRRRDLSDAFRGALGDPSALVRQVAIDALAQSEGWQAGPDIADRLRDQNPWVRYAAATALGEIGAERFRERLEEVLAADESEDVRRAAACALGLMGAQDTVRALYLALGDPSEGVRFHAHRALVRITGKDLGEDPRDWREVLR
jgi:HEAT repeat protein